MLARLNLVTTTTTWTSACEELSQSIKTVKDLRNLLNTWWEAEHLTPDKFELISLIMIEQAAAATATATAAAATAAAATATAATAAQEDDDEGEEEGYEAAAAAQEDEEEEEAAQEDHVASSGRHQSRGTPSPSPSRNSQPRSSQKHRTTDDIAYRLNNMVLEKRLFEQDMYRAAEVDALCAYERYSKYNMTAFAKIQDMMNRKIESVLDNIDKTSRIVDDISDEDVFGC